MLPASEEVEALVLRQLGGTALFAAKFREAAARALLLPKRRPGGRSPLWQQRKRAADLLAVAARVRLVSRCCSRRTASACATSSTCRRSSTTLRRIERREVKAVTVDSTIPSPFASALLFGYVANYIYDGDAPLAERRAQALAIDQAQLRELLGEAELRELLDADALAEVEAQLQHLDEAHQARSVDGVHDLLLRLGDLTIDGDRGAEPRSTQPSRRVAELARAPARSSVSIGGEARGTSRWSTRAAIATRSACRCPTGLPESLLRAGRRMPALDLARRYARTHGPFTTAEFAARYGLGRATAEMLLKEVGGAAGCSRASSGRAARPRVVRSGRSAVDAPPIAREAAQGGRAGRARRCSAGWSRRGRASCAGARARRAARRDREPAGRAAAGVDLRDRDPRGAHRGLQPGGPRRADGRAARSSGAASSRSAIATAGSRCT